MLKSGLLKSTPSITKQMKRLDGSLCSTSVENAAVFHQYFQQLYNRSVILDLTVLDLLPQNDIVQGYDNLPTDYEIKTLQH